MATPSDHAQELSNQIGHLVDLSQQLLGTEQTRQVQRAIDMALFFHEGQYRRLDGAPYVTHCLSVATNCLIWGLTDMAAVCTALLHDSIEDAPADREPEQRVNEFSPEVLTMVQALSKIRNLKTGDGDVAATYQRILQAASKDIRVLLIKAFDVMHNSESLHALGEVKARAKASIGLIYVGVTRRLGMIDFADRLITYLLPWLMPVQSRKAEQTLMQLQKEGQSSMDRLLHHLRVGLGQDGMIQDMAIEPKHIGDFFILAEKPGTGQLQRIGWPVFRLKLLVDHHDIAWQLLGRLHHTYGPMPRHVRDYLNAPRINGFRALTSRILWEGKPINIQIVLQQDNATNQRGILAQWGDQCDESGPNTSGYMKLLATLGDSDLRMSEVHAHVLPDILDIYTPKGDRLTFPVGSVVIDFAYLVHTHLGQRCSGARVNGIPCAPEHPLCDGDVVEILTSREARPQRSWLDAVKTARARTLIKQAMKEEEVIIRGVERLPNNRFRLTALDGPDIIWSVCCLATPGLPVVGRFSSDGHWIVHRASCHKIQGEEQWDSGEWSLANHANHHLFVTLILDHRTGALLPVLELLARHGINGHSITGKGRTVDTYMIEMEMEGNNPAIMGRLLSELLQVDSVQEIRRYYWSAS
ncbi:MAG: bifunctional (p)ppGpp synthetase/guanosine-3',5'-bis(diphosphate) 3'-pyrophosphohydrolase [Magnetococcales bacterium]|nr:bifunctional (p)ppGpp synthetase/guanosine-3',5'-bis(diphosphate) 3'-pyrophosphohydrolase [Magnetococcales bacterium]